MLANITLITFIVLIWGSCTMVFLKATKNTITQSTDFKTYVINKSKSEDGSITILGLVLMCLMCICLVYFIQVNVNHHTRIKNRAYTYLCQFSYYKIIKNYSSKMSIFNNAINAAYLAKFTPLAPKAKVTHKALEVAQLLYHLNTIRGLSKIKWCNKIQMATLIKEVPYLFPSLSTLKRDLRGRAIIRKKKWKIYLPSRYFSLKSNLLLQGSKLSYDLKEVKQPLSQLSGAHSWYQQLLLD